MYKLVKVDFFFLSFHTVAKLSVVCASSALFAVVCEACKLNLLRTNAFSGCSHPLGTLKPCVRSLYPFPTGTPQ